MDTTMRRGPGTKVGEPTDSERSASTPLRCRFAYPPFVLVKRSDPLFFSLSIINNVLWTID